MSATAAPAVSASSVGTVSAGATSYEARRGAIERYFDRTAREGWTRLTSDAPVGRVRERVRQGRDAMRASLLGLLPDDLAGRRLLDAGCGTGALALEAAARGADVVAVDVAAGLIEVARARADARRATGPRAGRIEFRAGDMLDAALGQFDDVVCMDSLIHYAPSDIVAAVERLAARTDRSLLFTVAPRTTMLALAHAAGRLFPRGERAPAIAPVSISGLGREIARQGGALGAFERGREVRIARPFYVSHAIELARR